MIIKWGMLVGGERYQRAIEPLKGRVASGPEQMGELVTELTDKLPHSPMGEFVKSMEYWHKMGALDQEAFQKYMFTNTAPKDMKLIAVIPPQVAAMLHESMPGIMRDKEALFKWLRRPENAAYRVPGVKY